MRRENIVWDARDPHRLGRFWAAALGAEQVTDEPDLVEARLALDDGAYLDLCFPRVADPTEHLLDLGATSLSAPGDLPWLVFADPSGNELCVIG